MKHIYDRVDRTMMMDDAGDCDCRSAAVFVVAIRKHVIFAIYMLIVRQHPDRLPGKGALGQ